MWVERANLHTTVPLNNNNDNNNLDAKIELQKNMYKYKKHSYYSLTQTKLNNYTKIKKKEEKLNM